MKDPIERQDAIDTLNVGAELLRRVLDDTDVVGADREKYSWGLGLIESYINDIEELPSAQPERPKGKWVEKPHVYGVAYCSLCDYELHINNTNFCPNCGADMRGDQNG